MLIFEKEKISLRTAALIAGITICIIAITAGFSVGVVQSKLIVEGDSASTMYNIKNSLSLFQLGIFNWLVTLIGDIVISWALYIFLKQFDNSLSLLGAWFRLAYSAILGIAILNLIFVAILLNTKYKFSFPEPEQLQFLVLLFIIGFNKIWSLGLIIFGAHLFIIGYLVIKSGFLPKTLGILLVIASFSYIFIHIMHLFLPQLESTTKILESILSLPMAASELGLGIWLLFKGGKSKKVKA
ncbi:DUF4386 domain-containing protein [Clostridium sp. YIM B02505]|uniref:DUF4386 domain-containing protein n=1 Tax=Clostridium yunnanense TaxID=2800325 RepID=A0ABS1ES26_9CLOT|nr:DUF4386 domain-containing protein [Clostridium yunnanense]MBK1812197.1 DUF4386 domain-containing protein [Clostridium yunnanense]